MQFGLKTEVIEAIQQVLEQNPRVDKALVFGSRAKGNYKEGSDIDLALKGDITAKDLLDLHGKLDALNLPYSFDLVNYNTINEPDLKEHIDRAGVEMYSRWKRYQLQNLGIIVTGKTPSSNFPDEFGDKMPFVTPTDYKNYNKWISITERSLSEKGVLKLKNKILPANSVLVTCIGSDMGKVAMNKIPVITNQQINSIIPNESVNANFLYYKLVNSYDELRTYGEAGTAVPILNKGDFEKITIEIPINKKEQEILANVLISFDDKINRLHSQNKTIEQLAETLFRQWFVEEVDESWKEEVLDKFISFDPKEKIDRNEKYRFFDMKCLSEVGMHISEGIYRNVSPASSFRNFDTLLAKITTCL
jgi:type I restriction enzyme S subunit